MIIYIKKLIENLKERIEEEVYDISFLDDKDAKKIKLNLEISFVPENLIFVSGNIIYFLEKICEKCLEKFEYVKKVDFNREYEIGKNQLELDLRNDIREELWLNIPFLYKCSNDCKGLCSFCGKNLNKEYCNCIEIYNKEFDKAKKEKNAFKDVLKEYFLNKDKK
ncbi:MAG: DUF177 domain-containing protein [Elusimicrobiota bacterium]|jgi:uncharacterized protein|nr:DUF177 domain-containing protein [Elusimicrobiota bacterium]